MVYSLLLQSMTIIYIGRNSSLLLKRELFSLMRVADDCIFVHFAYRTVEREKGAKSTLRLEALQLLLSQDAFAAGDSLISSTILLLPAAVAAVQL
jgi:phosphopantothenate synthetase